MNKIKISALSVDDSLIKDLLIDALEGGSNYWYFLPELPKREKNEGVYDAILRVSSTGEIPVHDLEDEELKLGAITYQNMLDAFILISQEQPIVFGDMLNENFDANDADVWFQYVVMKELVFG